MTLRHFAQFAAFQTLVMGVAFFYNPDWYSTGAYSWAESIIPFWGYASIWIGLWAGFSLALVRKVPPMFVGALLGLYSFVQLMFAYSIFQLTWNGAGGALVGSIQWGGYVYIAWRALFDRGA